MTDPRLICILSGFTSAIILSNGVGGQKINLAESLGQAVCQQVKDFSGTQQIQEALKDKNKYPPGKSSSCMKYHREKCDSGPTCVTFKLVSCAKSLANRGTRLNREPASSGMRILGGIKVDPKDFPYVVQIRWEPIQAGRARAKCSGTIIGKRWVLTSAQCAIIPMRRRNGQPTHAPGEIIFSGEQPPLTCTEEAWDDVNPYLVESVEVPGSADVDLEKMLVGNPNYDIALLKVNRIMEQKPIKLATMDSDCKDNGVLLGWGRPAKDTNRHYLDPAKIWVGQQLYRLNFAVKNDEYCTQALQFTNTFDAAFRFCGKSETPKAESCSSDCGGPLVRLQDNVDEPHYQCGVISRPACDKGKLSDRPDVIARLQVKEHLDWIQQVLTAY